jgi:hypothetical protein
VFVGILSCLCAQGADEKYLKALKYVEFENVFEGDDVPLARKLKVHALLNSAACKLLMGIAVREAVRWAHHTSQPSRRVESHFIRCCSSSNPTI